MRFSFQLLVLYQYTLNEVDNRYKKRPIQLIWSVLIKGEWRTGVG
ncbi:hypothetical protein AB7119_04745 [Proteus mirabilis]